MSSRKIAFIPGAFRPFGAHHMKMVQHYAKDCDDVVIVVSNPGTEESARRTNIGDEITPADAKAIIDMCLSDCGCQNCRCEISQDSNPVKSILQMVDRLTDCDVVLGVSSKDNDSRRFDDIDTNYFKNHNVAILPPDETAFKPEECDAYISASDIRGHIDDKDMLRSYLPVSIEPETFEKIYDILNGRHVDMQPVEPKEEIARDSSIFNSLLFESVVDEDDEPGDNAELDEEETEFSDLKMDDAALESAKCMMNAYNVHVSEDDEDTKAYNPKNNPDKAIDIEFYFNNGNKVEIFLDTGTMEWCSLVNGKTPLAPDQMEQFFGTQFCKRLDDRIYEMWPESDPFFEKLIGAVKRKKICVGPVGTIDEDSNVFRKGNIDVNKSREKNAAGRQLRTRSGRKIISPSDFDVKHDEHEAYYVWPEKNKEFKWSQWGDWEKIHVVARMRITVGSFTYGISFSVIKEDNENRGAKSYNLDLEPKLQYLTPEETSEMLKLSVVQRFLRHATKRLTRFLSIPDEEVYKRVNNPEKCTIDGIRKTKHVIKNTLKAIRDGRHDTYIYT